MTDRTDAVPTRFISVGDSSDGEFPIEVDCEATEPYELRDTRPMPAITEEILLVVSNPARVSTREIEEAAEKALTGAGAAAQVPC